MNPLRAPAHLADRLVGRARLTDAMLVTGDRRHWWYVVVTDLALFLGAVAAWALWPLTHDTWWGVVGGVLVGLQLGRSGITSLRRANAYRSGWIAGRQAMVSAMVEAQVRGMTPSEWLTAELHRDYAVLGLDPDEVNEALRDAARRLDDQ